MTFEHSGKWIYFDDYMTFGALYCFALPVTIYLQALDNGSITKKTYKIIGMVLTIVIMFIWIDAFFILWFPLTLIFFLIQIGANVLEIGK